MRKVIRPSFEIPSHLYAILTYSHVTSGSRDVLGYIG